MLRCARIHIYISTGLDGVLTGVTRTTEHTPTGRITQEPLQGAIYDAVRGASDAPPSHTMINPHQRRSSPTFSQVMCAVERWVLGSCAYALL